MSDKIDPDAVLDRVIDPGDGLNMSWHTAVAATLRRWPPEVDGIITDIRLSKVTDKKFLHCVVCLPQDFSAVDAEGFLASLHVLTAAEPDLNARAKLFFRAHAEFFSRLADKL